MEKLKQLNDLRKSLIKERNALEADVYFLADDSKKQRLKECKKHLKKTNKLIFNIIDHV